MPDVNEVMNWVLVIDLVIMSFYLVKSFIEFDKQQKNKQ